MLAVLEDFLVGLDEGGFLLELALEVFECMVKLLIEHEETHSEGEHVLAPYDGLQVEAAVLQAFLGQGGYGGDYDIAVPDTQFLDRIHGLESGSLNTFLIEGILVEDDGSRGLGPFGVCHECCRVHRHEHVAEVTRGVDFYRSDVYLETGDTRDCALRRTYLGRIIGECRDLVSEKSGGICEQRAGKLHTVAGVTCKTYNDILYINNLVLHIGWLIILDKCNDFPLQTEFIFKVFLKNGKGRPGTPGTVLLYFLTELTGRNYI